MQDKIRLDKNRKDKNRTKNNMSTSQAKPDHTCEVNQIFDYWREVMGKDSRAKLTQKRATKVKARLADGFTVDEIKQAIVGCAKSPHHMGQNDTGAIYDDLELICRDDGKLRRFMAIANKTEQPYSRETAETINNLKDMSFE